MKKIILLLSVALIQACALGALTESSFEVQPLGGSHQSEQPAVSVDNAHSSAEHVIEQVQESVELDASSIHIEVTPPSDISNPRVLDAPLVEEVLESPAEF